MGNTTYPPPPSFGPIHVSHLQLDPCKILFLLFPTVHSTLRFWLGVPTSPEMKTPFWGEGGGGHKLVGLLQPLCIN